MDHHTPAPSRTGRTVSMILAALAVVGVVLAALTLPPFDDGQHDSGPVVLGVETDQSAHDGPGQALGGRGRFDDEPPAVANLDPALREALNRAASDAADDGVRFHVNSGWRSAAYQAKLLRDAVSEYGSEAEAARWVATPETSAHVSGDAVDLGPPDSADWLGEHGDEFGLCQIYRNEPWHFELRPDAVDGDCPAMYDDPTQDPRMQQ